MNSGIPNGLLSRVKVTDGRINMPVEMCIRDRLEAVKACFEDPATQIATLVKPFIPDDGLEALENVNSPKVCLLYTSGRRAGGCYGASYLGTLYAESL